MYLTDFLRSFAAACGAILAVAALAGRVAAQAPAAEVAGVWIDHTGQGAVEITPCGTRMCGRVIWLKDPEHKSRSGKRICGTQILGDLRREGAAIELSGANTLKVTGYIGLRFLGETFTWKRATGTLERCAGV